MSGPGGRPCLAGGSVKSTAVDSQWWEQSPSRLAHMKQEGRRVLGPLALELQEYVGILNAREWCTCRRDIWMGSSARGERGKRHGGVGMRLSVTCQMRDQGEKQKSQCQRGGTAGGRHRVTGPGPGAGLPELDPKARTRALARVAYARSQSAGLRCTVLPTSGQPLVLLSVGVQDASGFRKAHTWERSQVLGISVPDRFLPPRFKLSERPFLFNFALPFCKDFCY